MNKKGISAVIATILLLVGTVIIAVTVGMWMVGLEDKEESVCEAFCIMNDMEYNYGSTYCHCRVCDRTEILGENYVVCDDGAEEKEFYITSID